MAALLAGQGVTEVSEQYNLPDATVSDLRKRVDTEFGDLRSKNRGEQIENLLFDYLTANLEALRKQAEVVSEAAYIERQPAGEIAVLHGVMADKSIRLLEAIHRANQVKPVETTDERGIETLPS